MVAPVYLLLGPETGEKQERIKAIRNQIAKENGSTPELHHYYPTDEGWEGQMYQNLTTVGFFASWQLVILSQVEMLGAKESKQLADFLKPLLAPKPAPYQATLILVSDETYLREGKVLQTTIPKNLTTMFYEMFDDRKEEWVGSYFHQHGITITPDGISTLLDMVENNTTELKIAANQLILFWQLEKRSTPVDGEAVETYMANTKEEDAFTLFPAIMARDLKGSIRILQQIFALGDSRTSFSLYSQLLFQFRKLLSIEELYHQTHSEKEAFLKAQVFGKNAGVYTPKDRTTYHKALSNYSLDQARQVLSCFEDADIPLKGAGDMSTTLWEQLLSTIILHNGKRIASPVFVTAASME